MSVCYFNKDYTQEYRCEYDIVDDGILVNVEYDIYSEIEPINNIIVVGASTEFKTRDILILDSNNKYNYLLKDAYYVGSSSVYARSDCVTKTKFKANLCLRNKDWESIAELPETPKISKLYIYSKSLTNHIHCSGIREEISEKEINIILQRYPEKEIVAIGKNNIRNLSFYDYWSLKTNDDGHKYTIDHLGCMELSLFRKENYNDILKYIYEIIIYFKLFNKNKLKIDYLKVEINSFSFDLFYKFQNLEYNNAYTENSVNDRITDFLSKCYSYIPYRKSKSEFRNIPYIVVNDNRGLEDLFLTYYRFIECYYKKQQIPNITKSFIKYSIKNNYLERGQMLPNNMDVDTISQEIISLRNHYVHSGYYIKNNALNISFGEGDSRNYTENKADVMWILERTRILKRISLDIIFHNMLGYDSYKYSL